MHRDNNICETCGFAAKGMGAICPHCGSDQIRNLSHMFRISKKSKKNRLMIERPKTLTLLINNQQKPPKSRIRRRTKIQIATQMLSWLKEDTAPTRSIRERIMSLEKQVYKYEAKNTKTSY